MIKNEQINQQYSLLYSQVPREHLPKPQELYQSLEQLKYDSPMHLFNDHAQQIVQAALQKTDFQASNDFQKSLLILKNKPNKTALFNLLSAVALTNSVLKLSYELYPIFFLSRKYTDEELNAFFRYMNNMFIEIKGMKDLRNEYEQYLKYLIAIQQQLNNDTKLMYLRVFNTFVRALSYQQIDDKLIDFISNVIYPQYEQDQSISITNLTSNIVGRCLLTLQTDKPELYQKLANNIRNSQVKVNEQSPCGKQLKILLFGEQQDDQLY